MKIFWLTTIFGYLCAPASAHADDRLATAADVEAVISDAAPLVAARPKKKRREVQAEEEEVDLSAMEESAPAANPHGGSTTAEPHFSVFFDLIMGYRPGKENFSFLNFHPLLFFEIVPTSDIIFSFEVNSNPRFYELDYQASKALTLRVGKIYIPFDDMNPHNLFGGIIGTGSMAFGSTAYLPDIFADLGVGLKYIIMDTKDIKLESHFYVVNGFGPANAATNDVPNFSSVGSADVNDNKSIGGRFHALISRFVGIGFSFYTGRWSNANGPVNHLLMLGGDAQIRLPKTEIRAGFSTMQVGYETTLIGTPYNRSGMYVELQQKFGGRDEWRGIARLGSLDTNDSIVDNSDNFIVGGGIRWKPNVITLSLEHYQDTKQVPGKTATSFTFLRTVIQL